MKQTKSQKKLLSTKLADPSVEICGLSDLKVEQLRERYIRVFKRPPPLAFGPDLLRKSIAHEIQVRAYGGLSLASRRMLREAVKRYLADPDSRPEPIRTIQVGSELARTWNGKMYRVIVLADGYGYAGKTYASLSEIAKYITGTNWNGPRFFGLRRNATSGK